MQKEETFHDKSTEYVLKEFNSRIEGLSEEESKRKKQKHGSNELPEKSKASFIILFLKQFNSLMIYVLIASATISFFLGRLIDAYVILAVVLINVLLGFFQEYKAEQTINSLKKMIIQQAKVYRNGELILIPSNKLVPGDIIEIEEGDNIPADCRIIETKNLKTIETSFTGEPFAIEKNARILPAKTRFSERTNMVFLGTFVSSGSARAIVTAIGDKTEIGKLARTIETIKTKKSHFKEKTDTLAKYVATMAIIGAIVTFLIGYFLRDFSFNEMFLFTMASLVAAIPEGLPAVLAIVLAIGAKKMAKKNAIIRDRYATETLGIVDVIISDKTGTITANTMTVEKIVLPGQQDIRVTGSGWKPEGQFFQNDKEIIPLENKQLEKFLNIVVSCNKANLLKENQKNYSIIGEPTEAALIVLGEKAGIKKSVLLEKEKSIDEVPFNSENKYRAALCLLKEESAGKHIYIVGAPEQIIKNCSFILKNGRKTALIEEDKKQLESKINDMTKNAMRVLAAAYKEVDAEYSKIDENKVDEFVFVGMVGMMDPPKPEVKKAIEKAKKAGIRVIMATGDHKNTAVAIAKEIGLITKEENSVLTEDELIKMSESEFKKAVNEVSIFARLSPKTKMKIAKTLQEEGKIVAMTGDGVNDAAALKQADIGISMNLTGTDVARESSKMILTDDNFASIIYAVEEGRIVFKNTRRVSFFLYTTSFAQYVTIITNLGLGLPLPLLPTQILWLNLVTAGITNLAITVEPSHHDILEDKPRKKEDNIINRDIVPFLILMCLTMSIPTLILFDYYLFDESKARTIAFAVMSLTQLFNMYNMRALKRSIFEIGVFSNKYVNIAFLISGFLLFIAIFVPQIRGIFGFTILSWKEILLIVGVSSLTIWSAEIYKAVKNKKPKEESVKK